MTENKDNNNKGKGIINWLKRAYEKMSWFVNKYLVIQPKEIIYYKKWEPKEDKEEQNNK